MKKILLGAMIASVALAASAAEVTSDNVVGYQKIDLANGMSMIGTSFQSVGVDNSIAIQDIKASGLKGIDWDTLEDFGDSLMIWDASAQGYLTTLNYAGDVQTESMTGWGVTAGTWFDMATGAPADMTLENGDAFWIISSTDGAKVTIAGEVPTTANTVSIVSGLTMVANPYPKAVKVNDLFVVTGLKGIDWDTLEDFGDSLMIWDPSVQGYLTTLNYAGDVQTESMTGWGVTAGTWFDMATGAPAETEIPAGGAFWIQSSGSGTLTFK